MTRLVRVLNLRHIVRQPLRAALAVLSVAAGVAVAVGVMLTISSLGMSVQAFGRQMGGPAPLRIVGPDTHGGVDDATVAAVRTTPGVDRVVPTVAGVVQVDGAGGYSTEAFALGVDCSIEALVGKVGCSPLAMASASDTAAPLISPSLARRLGPTGDVRTNLGIIGLRGAPTLSRLDGIGFGRVLVFPLSEAQRVLTRPGRVDIVYVRPLAGVAVGQLQRRLAAAVGPWNVVQRTSDPLPGLSAAAGFLTPMLVLLSLVALAIGALLIFNIMTLSLEQRRRELAIASALGALPRMVIGGAVFEAAAIGVVGGLVGVGLGVLAAHPLLGALSAQTERVFGVILTVHVTLVAMLTGVVGGGLLAAAAAWVPARRATRWDVVAALQQRGGAPEVSRRARATRAAVWTAIGFGGVAAAHIGSLGGSLHLWQPPLADLGLVAAIVALAVSINGWAPLLLSVARQVPARSATLGLALANISRQPKRAGAMAMAIGAAVSLGSGLSNAVPAINAGIAGSFGRYAEGRVLVTTQEVNNSARIDSKPPPAVLDAIARMPGVASLDRDYYVGVTLGNQAVAISAFGGRSTFPPVYAGSPPEVSFARGEVMIGPAIMRSAHVHPGSTLILPTPQGYARVVVGGVWGEPGNLGASVALPGAGTLTRLYGAQPASNVWARPAPGVSAQTLAARIRAANLYPGLRAYTPDGYSKELSREVGQFLSPFWMIQRVLFAVALISTFATMLLVGLQRRREHGMLAAVGLGPAALARLTLTEGALVGLVGSALGLLAGVGLTIALTQDGGVLFGLQAPFRFNAPPAVLYALVGTVVVVAGAAWPAWQTSRLQVIEALRFE